VRRAWLLGALNARLEYRGRAPERLAALLALGDEELIRAVAGPEAERLLEEHAAFDPAAGPLPANVERVCRHDRVYPDALREETGMPSVLHTTGELDQLRALLAAPTVAIVGTRAASDYGLEVAHGLARSLAASGVTVVGEFADGIGAAALAGALDGCGHPIAVAAGGVDVCHPARRRALHNRLDKHGSTLAELPCGLRPRSWCHTARVRIVVGLALGVILVEARHATTPLLHAQLARRLHRVLGAVPGRIGSPLAAGPHALLREGALLIRGSQDALDGMCGRAKLTAMTLPPAHDRPERIVLDHIARGCDTVTKLVAAGYTEPHTVQALAALELSGAIVRGDGGRYMPRLQTTQPPARRD
jgi:DNA processing protein